MRKGLSCSQVNGKELDPLPPVLGGMQRAHPSSLLLLRAGCVRGCSDSSALWQRCGHLRSWSLRDPSSHVPRA